MITPDTGATALGVTAAYVFWKWLRRPGWPLAVAAGVVLGLTLLTKTTWIILFALWPALWLVWRIPERRVLSARAWLRQGLQLGTMFVLGVYLLNASYGFEGSLTRLGDYKFVSEALGGPSEPGLVEGRNRFIGTWLGAVPVPVPKNYLLGVDVLKRDFERHFYSCLRGE